MNQTSRSDESIRYHSIGFSARGMVEYSGKERLAFIPAAEIRGIEVGDGFTAERQGLQLLLGLAGVTLGAWTFFHYILTVMDAGDPNRALPLARGISVMAILVGGWMLWNALRRGTYLKITTPSGVRKFAFHARVDGAELDRFLSLAQERFRYPISAPAR